MDEDERELLLITEYFHPDTAKTGQLMTDLATGLSESGLDLKVYTSQPNYHSGDNERQPRVSEHNDVLVKRIRAPQFRQSSLLRRLLNWAVFSLWMSAVLLFSRTDKQRELLFVSNPPFLPVFLQFVCRLRGWGYTYVVHDLYPEQPVELGYIPSSGVVDRIWTTLDVTALRGSKHIVVLGPVMKERVCEKAGVPEEKVTIIHNWADPKFIKPIPKEENWFSNEHDLVDQFTILYSGNIGEFHDLETVVEAAKSFKDEDVQILIIGEGDNKDTIMDLAKELGVYGDTVLFLPYQPFETLPYSLTSGDVSIVTVKKGFEGVCVSSKLYSSMAAGMPVLAIVQPYDDEARIIDAFDAGMHVPQGDVKGIIEAIRTWRANPELVEKQGVSARRAFEQRFTKEQSIDRYYKLLMEGTVCEEAMMPPASEDGSETSMPSREFG